MEITNDTQNRKGPVLDPALCRCCRTIKKCRLLTKEYEWLGKKEVYSDMIMDCFGLLLSHLDGDDKDNCICATCVARLREASAFRKQVLYWEEALLQAKLDLQKDDDKQVVEVKLESSDDDGSRDAPCPDDGFQNVSDSEDATALSQLKIVKTESTLTKPKLKKVITRKVSKCIDKPKKDLLLKRKLLNEMKKTKSKLNKQKRLDEPAKDPLSFRQGVHPDNKKRKEFGEFNSLYEDYRQKPDKFFEYTRLTLDTFDYVLSNIEADIRVQINFAKAVSPAEKLFLTLRYLGHGGSLRSLAQSYRLGRSTVGKSIYQTLKAIWKKFVHLHIPQPTSENLKNTANEFYSKWQFPNCFGSIGGKYFRVIKPRDSGSEFCNNKKYSALVLQAISDADYKFVAIEVGGKGKESDGGVFHISRLNTLLDEDKFNVPPPQNLPGSDTVLPHVLVGDEAYPLKKFLMRPFPSLNLNDEKRIFNERLSRARVTIECAFAMLTAKFRIFLKCLEINIKHAKLIIEVSCLLYNIIRDRDGDGDEDFRQFWANYSNPNTSSKKSRSKRNNRATFQATTIRHKFQHYFVTHPLSE